MIHMIFNWPLNPNVNSYLLFLAICAMYTQVIVTPKLANKTYPKYRSILSAVHVNAKKNIPSGTTIAGMASTPNQQATTSSPAFLLRYRVYLRRNATG